MSANEQQQKTRERAYQLWEEDGQPDGRDIEHWNRAEQETMSTEQVGEEPKSEPARPKKAS